MAAPTTVERLVRVQFEATQAIRDARAYAASLNQTTVATDRLQATTQKTSNFNVHGLQNASYQISDFAIQVAGGQSALLAFTQQSSQLLGGFGIWPGVVGGVVAILGTLGVTLLDVFDNSVQADESMERLRKTIDELGNTIITNEERLKSYSDTYGYLSEAVLESIDYLEKLELQQTSSAVTDAIAKNLAAVRDIVQDLNDINVRAASDTGQSRYADVIISREDIDALEAYLEAAKDTTLSIEEQTEASKELRDFLVYLKEEYSDLDIGLDAYLKRLHELALAQIEVRTELEKQTPEWREQTRILIEQAKQTDETTKALEGFTNELDRLTSNDRIDAVHRLSRAMYGLFNRPDTPQIPELPELPEREELPERFGEPRLRIKRSKTEKIPYLDKDLPPIPPPRPMGDIEFYEAELTYMEEITEEIANNYDQLLTPAVQGFTDAIFDANASWEDFAANMLESIAKMIVQLLIMKAIEESISYFSSNAPATSVVPPRRPQAPSPSASQFQLAHGGVVGGGGPVGVVTPGAFGTMAENGPEAVMPLRRTASGDLGVRGIAPTVNIYNQTDSEVSVSEGQSNDGGKTLEVFITSQVNKGLATGRFDKTLATSFGVNRRSR